MAKKNRLKKIIFEIPPLFILENKPDKTIKKIKKTKITSYRLKSKSKQKK